MLLTVMNPEKNLSYKIALLFLCCFVWQKWTSAVERVERSAEIKYTRTVRSWSSVAMFGGLPNLHMVYEIEPFPIVLDDAGSKENVAVTGQRDTFLENERRFRTAEYEYADPNRDYPHTFSFGLARQEFGFNDDKGVLSGEGGLVIFKPRYDSKKAKWVIEPHRHVKVNAKPIQVMM